MNLFRGIVWSVLVLLALVLCFLFLASSIGAPTVLLRAVSLIGLVLTVLAFRFLTLWFDAREKVKLLESKLKTEEQWAAFLNQLREIFISQRCVDEVLSQLAERFHEAVQEEIHRNQRGFEEYMLAIENSKVVVAHRKERFWNAHSLAKELGYRVREKYSDYLPKPTPASS